jgi:short-chain fatty acids transporter
VIADFSAPVPEKAKTAEAFGLKFDSIDMTIEARQKPGEWLEYRPVLIILVGGPVTVWADWTGRM